MGRHHPLAIIFSTGFAAAALIGCPGGDGAAAADGRSFGTDWRAVRSGPAEVFLRRVDSRWRVVAIVHDAAAATAWRADYTQFAGDLPRGVRLMSTATGRAFDLRLQLSQVEINPVLAASVFTVTVPDGTAPLTLDELRGADPMADAGR